MTPHSKHTMPLTAAKSKIPTTPYKLFIPGPVHVAEHIYASMARGLVGHRSGDFVSLYQSVQPGLQRLMGSEDPVFLLTASAWGGMEAAVRNVCGKRVLNCRSGAFSDKWHDVSIRCGLEADPLSFEWGQPIDPQAVREKLETGAYDAITLVHNETSTGLENPIAEIMAVVRDFPDVISIVDTVSSFSAVPIEKAALGIDVIITGTQKALALPPGLALVSVSERALKRAESMPARGYYFDFLELLKCHEKGMTPTTPCIATIYGLQAKLEDIEAEGLKARFKRHEELCAQVHAWGERRGFKLFPEAGYASKSLSCMENTHNIDMATLNERLKSEHGFAIDCGYGKLKNKTFRISHMGDETEASMAELLDSLDKLLETSP